MMEFLRRLLGFCSHEWKYVRNVNLNSFEDSQVEDPDEEVMSPSEFSKQICTKCKAVRFRKL